MTSQRPSRQATCRAKRSASWGSPEATSDTDAAAGGVASVAASGTRPPSSARALRSPASGRSRGSTAGGAGAAGVGDASAGVSSSA